MRKHQTIYLDYAAATPLDERVLKVMLPYFKNEFGNPSSMHHKGTAAKAALDAGRKSVAEVLNARPEEVVFTGGGTESCNLAILGSAQLTVRGHVITTAIEHHAVLDPIRQLIKRGWKATFLPVDQEGRIMLQGLKNAIRKDTRLVSIMYANNEIGSIQPIAQAGKFISEFNILRAKKQLPPIVFHTDASQAAGCLDLDVNRLRVDLLSASSSKFYGPKGVGFLYVRKGTPMEAVIYGGGQEKNLRSGTENVPGIAGLAAALAFTQTDKHKESLRLKKLQAYLLNGIQKLLKGAKINGPHQDLSLRLPNNVNFTIPGIEGEALVLYLDAAGICVSTGSACATGSTDASHVLLAIGMDEKEAKQGIRVSIGKETTMQDIKYFLKVLAAKVKLLKN